jgi:holdfast attachment protein HfaA
MTPKTPLTLLLATGLLAAASSACAQTMTASSAAYNAGYGRTADQENQPVNVQLTDANGNLTVENGVIRNTAAGSVFASAGAGVETNFSGAGGSGTASAIGNNLSVVVQGNYNTVIVNATQTNTGTVTATTTINGKP